MLAGQPSLEPVAGNDDGLDLQRQIDLLRDENAAIASALCGICVGLAQISEVHRAIVAQAFDYADRFVASGELAGSEETPGKQAQSQIINRIKDMVLSRYSEVGMRY